MLDVKIIDIKIQFISAFAEIQHLTAVGRKQFSHYLMEYFHV